MAFPMKHVDEIRRFLDEAQRARELSLRRIEREKAELAKHDAEIAAYSRVLSALGEATGSQERATERPEPALRASKSGGRARQRPLTRKWKEIFQKLHEAAKEPYTYDDIMLAAELAEHEIKTAALRTQMMSGVNTGLFVRDEPGKFRFTREGRDLVGINNNEGPADAEPSEVTGEANASPSDREIDDLI